MASLRWLARDVFTEHHQRRIAVAPGKVPEQLIVGAVLLDDVHDVLDERRIAGAPRHRQRRRGARLARRELLSRRGDAVVLGDRGRVTIELGGVGNRHDAHGASVRVDEPLLRLSPVSGTSPQKRRNRELCAGVVQRQVIRIPAGWNQAEDRLLRHVHHGDGVEASKRDEQRRAVRAHGQRGGRRSLEHQPERLEADGGDDLARRRVDDRDRIGVGVRHEQPLARLVVRHRGRVKPHVNRVRHLLRVQVDARDRAGGRDASLVHDDAIGAGCQASGKRDVAILRPASAPVADPRRPAILADHRSERRNTAGLDAARHPARFRIEDRQGVVEHKWDDGASAGTSARERWSAGQVASQVWGKWDEGRAVVLQQLHRAAGPVAGGPGRNGESDQRALANRIEHQSLECRGAVELPSAPCAILEPIEPVHFGAAGARSTGEHPQVRVSGAERHAVDPAVEDALDAGRRDGLPRGDHARVGHAPRRFHFGLWRRLGQ